MLITLHYFDADGNFIDYHVFDSTNPSNVLFPPGNHTYENLTPPSLELKPSITLAQKLTGETPYFKITGNSVGGTYVESPNYYFKVIPPNLEEVDDFSFSIFPNGSPLSLNSGIYTANCNWNPVTNASYGVNVNGTPLVGNIPIVKYLTFKNDNWNEDILANSQLTSSFTFIPINSGTIRHYFDVRSQDNIGEGIQNISSNLSENSIPCFAYDSFKKGPNPADPTPTFPYNQIDIGKNAIFNGWFNITNAFGLNVKKLFFEEYTKLFVSGTFALAFEDLVCGVGSELIVDGGTLYLNSGSISTQNYGCSDLTNPYAISCFAVKSGTLNLDADINFENGSFLLVNDNLNISQNRTIRIKTGSKLVVGENANFTYGTSSSIILEDGAVLEIDGIVNVSTFQSPNLIMQNGSSFKLANGAKLIGDLDFTTDKNFECGTNAEIIVNNNFTATNSVFTKSNSATKWRGFLVTNPTAILNLTNCSIQNAQIGIYGASDFISINLNDCTINDNIFGVVARNNGAGSVEIKNCSIFNNNYGVYTDLSGYAEIDGSEIYNNQKGIYTTVRGFVTAKNTTVYDNTNYGATISNEANAFFGSEFTGGQNRFFNNGTWDIFNYESSYPKVIFAQNNFWLPNGQAGNCNTNGNNCFDENFVAINGCAAVKTYPNADCTPNGNAVNSQEISNLLSAFESESDGDFALAEIKFLNFITTFPTSNYWSTALSGVVRNKKA